MSLKKKLKKLRVKEAELDWWIEKFGEQKGPKLWLELVHHRRSRNKEIIKSLSGVGFILKLLGK